MPAVLIALWIAAASWLNPATATEISSFQYFEDKTGTMTALQAASQNFNEINGSNLNRGFTTSSYWIKINLETYINQTLYLLILPAILSDSQAFEFNGHDWVSIPQNNPTLNLDTFIRKKQSSYQVHPNINNKILLLKLRSKLMLYARFSLSDKESLINDTVNISQNLSFFLGFVCLSGILLLVYGVYKKDFFLIVLLLWIIQFTLLRLLIAGGLTPGNNYYFNDSVLYQILYAVTFPITICLFILSLLHNHGIKTALNTYIIVSTIISVTMAMLYFINTNETAFKWASYWTLVTLTLLVFAPFTPSVYKRMGLPLALCIFALGVILLFSRLVQLAIFPSYFDAVFTGSLHIPFLALLLITTFSTIKKNREQFIFSLQNKLNQSQLQTERERQRLSQHQKFMLMLTHELKNNLSVLALFIKRSPVQQPFTTLAQQSVNDMDAIIERCSQVDKLERDEIRLTYKIINLKELIDPLVCVHDQAHRIRCTYQLSNFSLKTDEILLKTMVGNLIDNAFKYSPAGSPIELVVGHTLSFYPLPENIQGVMITVENKVGMLETPDEKYIFSKYYRGVMANHVSGSGLGLYLVKSMALLLGGELVYTTLNNHVKFKLWIPL